MAVDMRGLEESPTYSCSLCSSSVGGREAFVQHLKDEHEPLEIISFAAVTMMDEQNRDAAAVEFNRRFVKLRKIISG